MRIELIIFGIFVMFATASATVSLKRPPNAAEALGQLVGQILVFVLGVVLIAKGVIGKPKDKGRGILQTDQVATAGLKIDA